MKIKKLLASMIYLFSAAFVGTLLMNTDLPTPMASTPLEFLFSYGIEFLMILFGPITAYLWLWPIQPKSLWFMAFFLIGMMCVVSWLILFMKDSMATKTLAIPIIIWVIMGTLSTYVGLVASV